MTKEQGGSDQEARARSTIDIDVEFTIYPFDEDDAPPPYVQVALEACAAEGIEPEFAVLSIKLHGEAEPVLRAILNGALSALGAGANKIVLDIEAVDD
jgi:hypothetical protein